MYIRMYRIVKILVVVSLSVLLLGCSNARTETRIVYEKLTCPPKIVEGRCPACKEFILGESTKEDVEDCKEARDICALWHIARTEAWKNCNEISRNE